MNRLGNVSVGGINPIRIMGILNTSPESFYKKTIVTKKQSQEKLIRKFVDEGADFIDVGGMSTAPYLSTLVSEKIESKRILQIFIQHQNLSRVSKKYTTMNWKRFFQIRMRFNTVSI